MDKIKVEINNFEFIIEPIYPEFEKHYQVFLRVLKRNGLPLLGCIVLKLDPEYEYSKYMNICDDSSTFIAVRC